jgi:hypothetical protein
MKAAAGKSTWIAVAVAVAAVLAVTAVIAVAWTSLGGSGISAAGWIAMGLGILATLGLGGGLMALVFISSRRGYDEPGNRR